MAFNFVWELSIGRDGILYFSLIDEFRNGEYVFRGLFIWLSLGYVVY